jgi:NADPH2:quinone reductase
MPKALDFPEACAPLLVGTTAWRMLKVKGELSKGQTVLIVGAGGGLNSFCIQLARYMGAHVIALSSSEEKLAAAKGLGASEVINYRSCPDWHKEVRSLTNGRGVDIVVDNVGQQTFAKSLACLLPGGRLLTVGNSSGPEVSFDNRLIFSRQLSILGSTMGSKEDFRQILSLIWAGKLSPVIDRTMPLSDGRSAYEILSRGEQFGKIVLIP